MPTSGESARQFLAAFDAELERLGLNRRDLPGLAVTGGEKALQDILTHLRSLSPGATWHDVFPDMPRDWIPGRPETWIAPYRPLGAWDYQELPTGPAIHLTYRGEATEQLWLEAFVAAAQGAGWPVHGAGFRFENKKDVARRWEHAFVVLERGTDAVTLSEFVAWIDEQPSVDLAAVSRTGEERYRE